MEAILAGTKCIVGTVRSRATCSPRPQTRAFPLPIPPRDHSTPRRPAGVIRERKYVAHVRSDPPGTGPRGDPQSVARRVAVYGGEQVKHTGDGYMLAFTGPTRAVDCRQAILRDAARGGLLLRCGLHTGECERWNRDLQGITVHLAARIMAEGKPQTITTTQTVKDLLVGSSTEFDALGTRDLRGIPGQ